VSTEYPEDEDAATDEAPQQGEEAPSEDEIAAVESAVSEDAPEPDDEAEADSEDDPEPGAAFITGGSGFIGKRLISRLVDDGWSVRALARSDRAEEIVAGLGAEPVRGDLDDIAAMRAGAEDCDLAFHAAATVLEWGSREMFERTNVIGTRNALEACEQAGVVRFVHVSTEAALLAGKPLVNVNEDAPLRPDSKAYYCATKAIAEQDVLAANNPEFETVVVRPRLVWGPGDATMPALVEAVERGRFRWISKGQHLTSTTHVDNAVEGLILAAENGHRGRAYFITDGDPVVFREFITGLLATQGVVPPDESLPAPLVRLAAAVCERAWRVLGREGTPPITRIAYWVTGLEATIDITRARRELLYEPKRTIADGLAELRRAVELSVSE
jgi:nucleoside-diphosphate-sugar epimerase